MAKNRSGKKESEGSAKRESTKARKPADLRTKSPRGKSPSAGSAPAKSRTPRRVGSVSKAKMVKEITGLLDKMDEQSLAFIQQQANIIVTAKEYEEIRKKTMDALSTLEGARVVSTAADAVSIERKDDSFFNISVRGKPVFFNIDEMRALTKLCHAAPDGRAAARRLVAWMRRERADFLNETGIDGPGDPALPKLWETIVTTYKVKA